MEAIVVGIVTTVVGGLLLGLLLFLLNDYVFVLPELSGPWEVTTTTRRTAYKPYDGMQVTYQLMIWREGHQIFGSGEKVRERTATGEHKYTGDKRIRLDVRGYITKKYLNRSEAVIHIIEHGRRRSTTTIHLLKMMSADQMGGNFFATAADSAGSVTWGRKTSYEDASFDPQADLAV